MEKINLKEMTVAEMENYADAQLEIVKGYRKQTEELLGKWGSVKAEIACRKKRIRELRSYWYKRLTNQINKKRLTKGNENEVHIYYKTEPTFSETKEFNWDDYTFLVGFDVTNDVKLDDIYMLMQGEVWSPEGEAREFIQALGLKHTSMSIGDIIDMPDYALLEVATVGFKPVGRPKD